ncbi:MAG TPA: GMC family oxidoreductase [Gammaproteobacteria bacterium]|nr:GMC family oxidoreductase [Gammaproteobacteria bacterium]
MKNQASSREYDVIVVGSGAGGAATAYRLVQAGLRVLLIEKGERLPKNEATLDVQAVIHEGTFKSKERWRDGAGRALVPEEYFNLGGKTKWYGAALAQFRPAEFLVDAEGQYLGWPCGFDEMRPYYEQADILLGIREFGIEPALALLLERLARRAPSWHATPLRLGLKRQIVDVPREAAHFDGFASPTGLKSEAESALLDRIAHAPNLSIVTGHAVTALVGDVAHPKTIKGVRIDDGRVYVARETVLAAGALHSPRLLGRYLELMALERMPIAAVIGRYLKLHHLTAVLAISPSRKADLLRKTTLLLHDELPHSSVQPLGFDGELIATLIPRFVPRPLAAAIGARAYGFFLQTEDGSSLDNRVIGETATGRPPVLDYDPARVPFSRDEHRRLVRTFCRDLRRAGYVALSQAIGLHGTAHACGTLRAGADPHDSVVDAAGRVHGFEGLSVADGSVLPRSSRVNPALTIYAWGLRVADAITRRVSRELAIHSTASSVDIAAPEVAG